MTFTKQHFQFIADVVSNIDDKDIRQQTTMDFVHKLQETNPGFKPAMFVKACGATNNA